MASYLIVLMVLSTMPSVISAGPAYDAPSGRIIVVSNETAIPIAIGTPWTGLEPFEGTLTNKVGVHISGQVVDGNYTPLWQAGHIANNPIADAVVHWAFGPEPDRSHTVTADGDGLFTIFLTPNEKAPDTISLRFWFDGQSDSLYGIPIYPPVKTVYDVQIGQKVELSVEPLQTHALAGDTVIVKGRLWQPQGPQLPGQGLMAFFDGMPVKDNPHAGWYIDDLVLGPYSEDFESGSDMVPSGKGSQWAIGTPTSGPRTGHLSLNCAATGLEANYEYRSDTMITTPTIDLQGYDPAVLFFESWSEIDPEDTLMVELSNDDGITWPVSIPVDSGPIWDQVSIPVGTFKDTPYGTVEFTDKEHVKVRFRLVSNALPIGTDQNGNYEFLYEIPGDQEVGPAQIRVEHPASSSYARVSSSATIDIARRTLIEPVAPSSIYRGVPVEISARLLDDRGQPLTRAIPGHPDTVPKLHYWLRQGDTKTYLGERVVGSNGRSALGYDPPRTNPLGPAELRFSFGGNDFYSPMEVTRDLVYKAHTEVNILSPMDASLLEGDHIDISGSVNVVRTESINDVDQDPVIKRDVSIFMNGDEIGVATTDVDGLFTYRYEVTDASADLGNAVIRVDFGGDLVYGPSTSMVDFSILSFTNLQLTPRTLLKGSTGIIDGSLTSMGGGVQGIVELDLEGVLFKKVVTGASGRFAMSFEVPWDTDTGSLELSAIYKGSGDFRPSSADLNLTVEAETTIMMDPAPIRLYRGMNLMIKGKVMETFDAMEGEPVIGGMVTMLLPDGETAQVLTGLNGNFSYYYRLPTDIDLGQAEVVVSFLGAHQRESKAVLDILVATPTKLVFKSTDRSLDANRPSIFEVTLSDDNGRSIEGGDVQILLLEGGDEVLLFRGPTDSVGTVAFKAGLNTTGTLTIVARYAGETFMEPSEGYTYVRVRAATVENPPLEHSTVALGGGLSLVIILAIMLTESGKYLVFKSLLVPMYTKLKKMNVLDHFVRGQIFGLIRMQPGAHYNLIKKKLDLKNGVLSYHLRTLEREGYVISELDGIYKRFYPNHVKFEVEYPFFLSKVQERIMDFIRATPGLTQKEVAKGLGVSTSTLNDNIRVLTQNKLLLLKRDGKRTRVFVASE